MATKHKDSKSEKVRQLLKAGKSAAEIAKAIGCTVGLVYNVKSRMAGGKGARRGRRAGGAKSQVAGLDNLIAVIRNSEQERERLRSALQKIASLVDGLL